MSCSTFTRFISCLSNMHILVTGRFKLVVPSQAAPEPVVQAIAQNTYQAFSDLRAQAQFTQCAAILCHNFFQFNNCRVAPHHEPANDLDSVNFCFDPRKGNINAPVPGGSARMEHPPVPSSAWNRYFL